MNRVYLFCSWCADNVVCVCIFHLIYRRLLLVQVAEICVDALSAPAATNKVVEVVADQNEIVRPAAELFAGVQ